MDALAVCVIRAAIWALAWPRVVDVQLATWWRINPKGMQ